MAGLQSGDSELETKQKTREYITNWETMWLPDAREGLLEIAFGGFTTSVRNRLNVTLSEKKIPYRSIRVAGVETGNKLPNSPNP